MNLISFSNVCQYMIPPIETNVDFVVHNSVTPSANTSFNLRQRDLRILNIQADLIACSNIGFQKDGVFVGAFSGNYLELRDIPESSSSQPVFYESLSFFPDKFLTLVAQSNSQISGLSLNSTGIQPSYLVRADRIVCNEMSLLNGPIENVASASGVGVVSYVYHSKSTTVPYCLSRTNISRKHEEMY